mmetsp:Transcript_11590/g.24455  ORF Transcript_11590/g.24455 Transcript_11590/m.24455 type:complete len:96 (+) Transcript_11590:307-594(+)
MARRRGVEVRILSNRSVSEVSFSSWVFPENEDEDCMVVDVDVSGTSAFSGEEDDDTDVMDPNREGSMIREKKEAVLAPARLVLRRLLSWKFSLLS